MRKKPIIFIGVFCLVTGIWAAENPEAVSPGHELSAVIVNEVCPTFSWAQVSGAASYKIAVFEMKEMYEGLSYHENLAALGNSILTKNISGSASSWTPSLEESLKNGGRYVWFVQAQDAYGTGAWSVGKKFAVRASLGITEIKEKVKQQLKAKGVKGDLVDEAFEGIQDQDTKSKSGGELKGKEQALEEKETQAKFKTQGNKEIRSKENQAALGIGDFVAEALGEEGDTHENVYYGDGAGVSLDISGVGVNYAYHNSFFGYAAGNDTDSGSNNTFIGRYAGCYNTSGTENTFIGCGSGKWNNQGNHNVFIGYSTGYLNTTGYDNTLIGYEAGYSNTEGVYNTFMGRKAGYSNTTGNNNTIIGNGAGNSNEEGDLNTMLGCYSGYNSTGSQNVFLGSQAGYNETGSQKLYIENSASSNPLIYGEFDNDLVTINGHLSVHNGDYLGLTGDTSQLTVDTTAKRARFKLQADGDGTNPDDFFNFTMRNDYGDVTLSVRDSSAGVWLPMLSYEYLNSKVDFKDNDIVTTGTISSGGGAYTSGGAWIEASSRDYKENIVELGQSESIRALESLNPVRYKYKNKKDEEFLGFIAEDVPDLVAMNGRRGMRAMDIVAVLTKVVQDQQKKNKEYERLFEEQGELLKKQIEHLKEQNKIINELKERIKELDQK